MKQIILLNIKKLFFIVLGIGFLLYAIIHIGGNFIDIFKGYFIWIFNFFIGEYGQSKNGLNIVLFPSSNDKQFILFFSHSFFILLSLS